MDYVKKAIWGPDPKEQVCVTKAWNGDFIAWNSISFERIIQYNSQWGTVDAKGGRKCLASSGRSLLSRLFNLSTNKQMRKINLVLRKNKRELDKSMNQLQTLKKKTETLIKKSAKEKDFKTAKLYAKEIININRQHTKLHTSKTRLDSIGMSVNEQWQMNKLTQSLHALTTVMKDVNSLMHIGVVLGTMQELSKELMKAGIINEMMEDMVDLDFEEDEELESESQQEVDKIIESLTKDKFKIAADVPAESFEPEEPQVEAAVEDEEALDEMRERLRALQE